MASIRFCQNFETCSFLYYWQCETEVLAISPRWAFSCYVIVMTALMSLLHVLALKERFLASIANHICRPKVR
jgi:hypothetical protein